MNKAHLNRNGRYPETVYLEKCDKNGIFIPGTIENGYAQWQPKLQTELIDFESLEQELGVKIHPQLKDFFSTYCFMLLNGYIGENEYCLDRIPPNIDILQLVRKCQQEGDINYMKPGVFFAVGDANIDGNQDCGLYVNNDSGEVICVDWDKANHYNFEEPFTEMSFKVADSLEELLNNMEVRC